MELAINGSHGVIFRYYFAQKFQDILAASLERRMAKDVEQAVESRKPWPHRFLVFVSGRGMKVVPESDQSAPRKTRSGPGGVLQKLRPDMIRRMDDAPKLVNPSGWVSEGGPPPAATMSISLHPAQSPVPPNMVKADPDTGSGSNAPNLYVQDSDSVKSDNTTYVFTYCTFVYAYLFLSSQ